MPWSRIRVEYESVKLPGIYVDELAEICVLLGMSLPQRLSLIVHETYLAVKQADENVDRKAAEKIKEEVKLQPSPWQSGLYSTFERGWRGGIRPPP
ncbi:hypothetical protein IMZ38_01940 [Thermosphaera chiliense]|uniref:Uncharacterized protein n=1 Tax=Thermosphaera chiliense TaxID=3402707 RepID=A0A7M1URX1_9CREN|nr:hypothetical protein [Thermosphaera aggregans]QOR94719.1 hypothetical protein IMZ38_01940 [Thermosphaera aggregans]